MTSSFASEGWQHRLEMALVLLLYRFTVSCTYIQVEDTLPAYIATVVYVPKILQGNW